MSYSYSGNPNSSALDACHFLMGDTNPSEMISTDEECLYALAQNGQNPYLAAAMCFETKAAHFLNRPTVIKRGDRSTTWANPVEGFLLAARTLRMQAAMRSVGVYAGGIDVGDKEANREDRSLVFPFARSDLHSPYGENRRRPLPIERDWW